MMDVLSDALGVMRLSGAAFFTAEFSSPWALDSPSPDLLASVVLPEAPRLSLFHIVIHGGCVIDCVAHPALTLQERDAIVFPHGAPHRMRRGDGAPSARLDYVLSRGSSDELPRVSFGSGPDTARFLCGYLHCGEPFAPFFDALPTMLLARRCDDYTTVVAIDRGGRRPSRVPAASSAWLGTTIELAIAEVADGRPGNAAMLGRLAEIMFVEIVREYMQQLPEREGGWLGGVRDPCVGKALRLLHANPSRDWTVDQLAREVAVSRSALALRFTSLVGEPPMTYLTRWRMQLAQERLRRGGGTIQEVAASVGYESEPAFNRAFKRAVGAPPGQWRRISNLTV